MFKINHTVNDSGFQMTFSNGWTVSCQFGRYVYSSNKYSEEKSIMESRDCEIAAWDKNGQWYHFDEDGDCVEGYCNADDVAAFIWMISKKEE